MPCARAPAQLVTAALLRLLLCCVATTTATQHHRGHSTHAPTPSWLLSAVERCAARAAHATRPKPAPIYQQLPEARPQQPWQYRSLQSALSHSVAAAADTHALLATVSHAPLAGVTSAMLQWWWANVEGDAQYAGDGRVWSKYLQWHPRDHVQQRTLAAAPAAPQDAPARWQICEWFVCSRAGGYTRSSYQQTAAAGRDAQRDEVLVQAVVVVEQLGQHSMALTIPPALGLSSSIWRLQHTWADSPAGLLVNSTQSVGALQPGPRPLWFARLRNALVRGLFGRGHNPVWLLERWVQHCIEEIGNLQHILPILYAAAHEGVGVSTATTMQGSSGSASQEGHAQQAHMTIDEL